MKSLFLLLALLMLSCAQAPERSRQAKLMDEIEQKLRLPEGASRLDRYARFYAFGRGGKVVATYVIPYRHEPQPDEGCEQIEDNGTWHEVECEPPKPWPEGASAGQRKWVATERDLPFRADGGCSQVSIDFDPATHEVEASCNGAA
jgi:hypothetical protein